MGNLKRNTGRKGRRESSYEERKRYREDRSAERRRKSKSPEKNRRGRSKSPERSKKRRSTETIKKTADIPCADFMKPGGCSYKSRCKFSHKMDDLRKKDDCKHWMLDDCKFANKVCKDKHDYNKRGMNLNRNRSEGGQMQGFGNPPMGLASQGIINGGGAPQFPQFPQLGAQGAGVWGQGGQPQLVQLLPGQQVLWPGQGAPGLQRN